MRVVKRSIAVAPMRTQPLHLGHVNLVCNLLLSFDRVRVIVGNQPLSPHDPFPLRVRLKWWRQAMRFYGLDRLELRVGAHGLEDHEREARYFDGKPEECTLVSGNPEVLRFWEARVALRDLHRMHILPLIDGLPHCLLTQRDSNGRRIRAGLNGSSGEKNLGTWLPDFVRAHVSCERLEKSP